MGSRRLRPRRSGSWSHVLDDWPDQYALYCPTKGSGHYTQYWKSEGAFLEHVESSKRPYQEKKCHSCADNGAVRYHRTVVNPNDE